MNAWEAVGLIALGSFIGAFLGHVAAAWWAWRR